jgi:hypothetical protein
MVITETPDPARQNKNLPSLNVLCSITILKILTTTQEGRYLVALHRGKIEYCL